LLFGSTDDGELHAAKQITNNPGKDFKSIATSLLSRYCSILLKNS